MTGPATAALMANPNRASARTAWFIPMTVPFISTSGPPLLPVLIVASVWIKLKNCWPCSVLIDLPRPLTIPNVAVGPPFISKAFPRVMTQSPTRMSLVSDSVANGSPSASILRIAISVTMSFPTTVAG